MRVRTFAAAMAVCGLLVGPAFAQEAVQQPAQPPAQQPAQPGLQPAQQPAERGAEGVEARVKTHMESSDVIGLQIRNAQGENLGDVNDLLVDMKRGEVKHLVLSFGGFLGLGTRLFAVPFDQAKFVHGEEDKHFVYNVTKEQLENAPSFERDRWPNVNDPTWHRTIDTHYGADRTARQPARQDAARRDEARREATPDQPRPDVQVAGQEGVRHDTMFRASTIKDLTLRDKNNRDLGTINDLIVDMNQGKVEFATFAHGATLGLGGRTIAVPFDRLQIVHTEDDRYLVLQDVTDEQLRAAPEFRRDSLRDADYVIRVERHYGPARTAERPGDRPAEAPRQDLQRQ